MRLFGGSDNTNVPSTISDKDMASLKKRAREANPHLDSITDPRAISARRAAARQHDQADSN